jgi:hypothetical protein
LFFELNIDHPGNNPEKLTIATILFRNVKLKIRCIRSFYYFLFFKNQL